MNKRIISNVKLGAFVIAGLFFLVLLLYSIGKNRNIFGGTYQLKARFRNVQGLVVGNNVRFSGIETGTVTHIEILSDTVIEVSLAINKKMRSIIRKNALASVGSEGLVGNKVVNIVPSTKPAELAKEGDVLQSKKMIDTDEIIQTLNNTNSDLGSITSGLKTTVQRINNSTALWALLNDDSLPIELRHSVKNIRKATGRANEFAINLNEMMTGVKRGQGSLGAVLTDTSFAVELKNAILKIQSVGETADSLAASLQIMANGIQHDVNHGKGAVHSLLKDSSMVVKLNESLDNIQKGTEGFNRNMEALKHNFLFRGYFKKQEKKKERDKNDNP